MVNAIFFIKITPKKARNSRMITQVASWLFQTARNKLIDNSRKHYAVKYLRRQLAEIYEDIIYSD